MVLATIAAADGSMFASILRTGRRERSHGIYVAYRVDLLCPLSARSLPFGARGEDSICCELSRLIVASPLWEALRAWLLKSFEDLQGVAWQAGERRAGI